MSQFNESEWVSLESVKDYVDNAENYILERRRMLNIAKSYYKFFLKSKFGKTIKVLDLGCGDGAFIHEILLIDPQIEGTLVDGSEGMLEAAKKRFSWLP